ncbi:MAG: hypothetical protein RBR13_11545, partial [Tenuifilaceae bacterium]|nr:hypothetical protein [Tenuifilaceae bacterium]
MKKLAIAIIVLLVLGVIAYVSLRPHIAEKSYQKGLVLIDSLEYNQAIDAFSKALKIKDEFDHYFFARGKAYASIDNDTSAIVDFTAAIEINPDISDYYLYRGISSRQLNLTEKAFADINKA